MIDLRQACKDWYSRQDVAWEILKDVRSHSSDFKGRDVAINRFYRIGDFGFLLGQLKERFMDAEKDPFDPFWHFYRSIAHIRLTKVVDGKTVAADLNEDFDSLIRGFDIPLDFDNKPYKKWFNEEFKKWKEEQVSFPSAELCREMSDKTNALPKKEADKVAAFLDEFKAPYTFISSGTGFYVKLEWQDLQPYFLPEDYGTGNKAFAAFLLSKSFPPPKKKDPTVPLEPQYCDPSTVGEGRLLIRVNYTIHPSVVRICAPLSSQQQAVFEPSMTDVENFSKSFTTPKTKYPFNHKRKGDLKLLMEAFNRSKHADKLHEQKEQMISKKEQFKKGFRDFSGKEREELLKELQAEMS